MHHFSTRCVAALLCVHPVLSLCEKQLWEHVYVRFDLHSEEAHTNRVDAGWVNVHSHCEVTPPAGLSSLCRPSAGALKPLRDNLFLTHSQPELIV